MIKYKVSHTTTYEYDAPVAVCQNVVYLTPRATPYQSCSYHRLTVRPGPASPHRRTDYFGNTASLFSLSTEHRRLRITAHSTVEVLERPAPPDASTAAWEKVRDTLPQQRTEAGLAEYQFCFASPRVPLLNELADYGRQSFTPNRPIVEALRDLTHRVNTDFTYDATATTVNTPIDEAFENRRGVCQDLAHVMIGCLRPLGLAARYVSGYLHAFDGTSAAACGSRCFARLGVALLRRTRLDRRRSDERSVAFHRTHHSRLGTRLRRRLSRGGHVRRRWLASLDRRG